MKLLLKNARIYDGTGAAARHGDVLVDKTVCGAGESDW